MKGLVLVLEANATLASIRRSPAVTASIRSTFNIIKQNTAVPASLLVIDAIATRQFVDERVP